MQASLRASEWHAQRTLLLVTFAVCLPDRPAAGSAAGKDLPPATLRVSFAKHGSDWSQGGCSARGMQSPVNLNDLFKPTAGSFSYFYADVHSQNIIVKNDGRTISVETTGEGFGGVSVPHTKAPWYSLKRIDFHASSEHTFLGKHAPLEVQLVHQASTIEDATAGRQLVTVSILVDCDNAPTADPVWPGFLQRHGRRHRSGEVDAQMDPATLAQTANAAGSGGTVSADGVYTPPAKNDANFNPTLQFFVEQQPPVFNDEVDVYISPERPMHLGTLLANGTYFMYQGSETLPPCEERVIWLVRRERVKASDAQVRALFDRLHKSSKGAGNYRTIMPLNQRSVQVWSANEQEPAAIPLRPALAVTLPQSSHDDERESRSTQLARDAITIAKATADYAKDLDIRLRAGAEAHFQATQQEPPAAAQAPSTVTSKSPLDEAWAAEEIAGEVKQAIRDAVVQNVREVMPAAASLAKSYLRQELLRAGGFLPGVHAAPPMIGPVPAPAPPGPAPVASI